MKKVKISVTKNYKDIDLKRLVKKGETITVSEDRAKKIVNAKFGEIVQVETNPLPKAAQVTTKAVPKAEKQLLKVKKSKSKDAKDDGKKD